MKRWTPRCAALGAAPPVALLRGTFQNQNVHQCQRRFEGYFDPDTRTNPYNESYMTTVQPASLMYTDHCIVNKQCSGIPFHVSDEQAVDALFRHHQTTVEIKAVQRLMVPFWLCRTAAGGTFRGEYYRQDPTVLTHPAYRTWIKAPQFNYSYALEEHMTLNQISASYEFPARIVEAAVAGTHVPSMLLSRYELLEALADMARPPTMIPFALSTDTATTIIDRRISRGLVTQYAERELVKHYGSFTKCRITITSMRSDLNGVRPVLLPLYAFQVSTRTAQRPLPAFVCGATGRVHGPVVHFPNKDRARLMGATAVSTAVVASMVVDPPIALMLGTAATLAANVARRSYITAAALKQQTIAAVELEAARRLNAGSDATGYKWSVESEEAAEYQYREELRFRERRRVEFQRRVQEEADRDDARATGKMFGGVHKARHDVLHADPQGYYALLGLKGKERSATVKDIQAAFRSAVRQHHPDLNAGNEESAKTAMHGVLKAYGILRDAKKRRLYDAGGATEEKVES